MADPKVNPHVAALMRFVAGRVGDFLLDLMAAIERSDRFINPAAAGQDAGLAVLMGRPLAIARGVLSLSTAGAVLPVSQANTSPSDALAQAVQHGWTDYGARQANTCAGLDRVAIPLRLGDLTNIDDGLVAYLPETAGPGAVLGRALLRRVAGRHARRDQAGRQRHRAHAQRRRR